MKRLAPDSLIIVSSVVACFGYLLPWFQISDQYQWWYSGWNYTTSDGGAGWTWLIYAWLAVALLGGLWARRHVAAAMTTVVATIGAMIFSIVMVGVSFARTGQSNLDHVPEMRLGFGLPILAIGFGLLLAAAVRAIAVVSSERAAVPLPAPRR
jgi:MYXO-CTERM domain-containing protein